MKHTQEEIVQFKNMIEKFLNLPPTTQYIALVYAQGIEDNETLHQTMQQEENKTA